MDRETLGKIRTLSEDVHDVRGGFLAMRDAIPADRAEAFDELIERLGEARSDAWQMYQDWFLWLWVNSVGDPEAGSREDDRDDEED